MITNFLQKKKHVVLIAHQRPDGDAIGSLLATFHLLSQNYAIQVSPVLLDEIPLYLSFLPGIDYIKSELPETYDSIIILDSGNLSRTGLNDLIVPSLNIDHHESNNNYGDVNHVDSTAASTTQILAGIAAEEDMKVDSNAATCMLTGLYTDTGGFIHRNTNASVFSCAAFLSELGADIGSITSEIFKSQSFESLQKQSKALAKAQIHKNVVYTTLYDIDSGSDKGLKTQVVSSLNTLKESDVSVVFSQDGDTLRISYRTNSDTINVSDIAAHLGGGGHQKASGIAIVGSELDETGIVYKDKKYTYEEFIEAYIIKYL